MEALCARGSCCGQLAASERCLGFPPREERRQLFLRDGICGGRDARQSPDTAFEGDVDDKWRYRRRAYSDSSELAADALGRCRQRNA
jgi:hypothetical protein